MPNQWDVKWNVWCTVHKVWALRDNYDSPQEAADAFDYYFNLDCDGVPEVVS